MAETREIKCSPRNQWTNSVRDQTPKEKNLRFSLIGDFGCQSCKRLPKIKIRIEKSLGSQKKGKKLGWGKTLELPIMVYRKAGKENFEEKIMEVTNEQRQ